MPARQGTNLVRFCWDIVLSRSQSERFSSPISGRALSTLCGWQTKCNPSGLFSTLYLQRQLFGAVVARLPEMVVLIILELTLSS